MKPSKLREQSSDELRQLSVETRRGIFEARAKRNMKDSSDHPLRVRILRRDLARMLTVLKERGGSENA